MGRECHARHLLLGANAAGLNLTSIGADGARPRSKRVACADRADRADGARARRDGAARAGRNGDAARGAAVGAASGDRSDGDRPSGRTAAACSRGSATGVGFGERVGDDVRSAGPA